MEDIGGGFGGLSDTKHITCQFSHIDGSARPAGASCDTQTEITEHTFAGPRFSGLRKCLNNIL